MLAQGVIVGGYRIDGVIGRGGMGVVYEAFDEELHRTVALKVIAADLSADQSFVERFRREGRVQAAIEHPHIIPVYATGTSEHGLYLAMRLIRGHNLHELIDAGNLDEARAVHLLGQVAGALDAAHEAGLIHRDIKPQNILVDVRRDHAYLADFGITKARDLSHLTQTGQIPGTPDYMSPEQVLGREITHRSDIYALGGVLFECLTGSVPYPRDTPVAVLFAQVSDSPPTLHDRRPELPGEVDAVIQRAMAKEPDDRYASASEFLDSLGHALAPWISTLPARDAASTADRPPSAATVAGDTLPADTEVSPPDEAVPPPVPPPATVLHEPSDTVPPQTVPEPEPEPAPETMLHEPEPEPEPAPETMLHEPAPETVLHEPEPAPETVLQEPAPPEPEPVPETVLEEPAAPEQAPVPEAVLQEPAPAAVDAPAPETVLAASAEAAATRAGATDPDRTPARPTPVPPVTPPTLVGPASAEPAVPVAEPPPDTLPVTSPSRPAAPSRGRGLLIGAGVVLLALLVAGFLVGRSTAGGDEDVQPDSGPTSAASGDLSVSFASPWAEVEDPPSLPGLALDDPVAVAPGGTTARGGLVAGEAAPAWPTFLPAGLRALLPANAASRGELVEIGGRDALRYRNLKPRGYDGTMTLYALPQADRAGLIACYGAGSTPVPAGCDRVAATASLSGAKPYPLQPSAAYAKGMSGVAARLGPGQKAGIAALAAAKTPAAQQRAGRRLERSCRDALRRLRRVAAPAFVRPQHVEIVRSLQGLCGAYGDLAAAAGPSGSAVRYDKARKAVTAADARFRAAGTELQSFGYAFS